MVAVMDNNTPIFFYICLIGISTWGPILIMCGILYPERLQKQALERPRKGLAKFNPSLPSMRKKSFLLELRLVGSLLILFYIIMIIMLLFLAQGWFYKLIAGLQIAFFIGSFLFAKFFPDKFWGKYK